MKCLYRETTIVLLFILIIETVIGYDFKCPSHAEWKLRANVSCLEENKYVCLFHLLEETYQENCLGPERSDKGSNLVFQPLFNIAECNAGRYQPIIFTTQGNSECILISSKCGEEGQVVYSNGSSSKDMTCRCDYTKGYMFVSKPENDCFCTPSEEDCSCVRVKCTKLSPDYQCLSGEQFTTNTTCEEIPPQRSYSRHYQPIQYIKSKIKRYSDVHVVGFIILALMAVLIVLTVITVIAHEWKERRFEKLKRKDKEKEKMKELIEKGGSGKLYFARLVFIGKNGVGKTSLMRRLLWHNKEDVTDTKTTDGIEVEKCNIDIKNGKWRRCDKIDDNLTRLIHQVYRQNIGNEDGAEGNKVDHQERFGLNTDKLSSISDSEFSVGSDDNTIMIMKLLNTDTENEDSESDNTLSFEISRQNNETGMTENIDNDGTKQTDGNQIQPENFKIQNETDNTKNCNEYKADDEYGNDENINQMTSTIMEAYFQRKGMEQDDMMAISWLWDFAGQKDFYATHQVFLSKCAVYLLVTDSLQFSLSEQPGIDLEDSAQFVSFWFDAIHCFWSTKENGRLDPPIIVVCTNEDKLKNSNERQRRQDEFQKNLGRVLKQQKKKKHLRNIFFVSNTEDDDDVFEKIREEISRQAMDMKDWGRDCPLKWLLFQQVLGKLKDNDVPISTTTTLQKIAKHIGITNDKDFKLCLQYCHDMGEIIYFDENNLRDHVILNPKWLVDAFRCLVSHEIQDFIKTLDDWITLTETGELTDVLISLLFQKEPKLKFFENKAHLLEVMKRFDIIVTLNDSTALYMPCMMEACPFAKVKNLFMSEGQSFWRTSWLCLQFDFLPPAFFNHILAWYIMQYRVSDVLYKGNTSTTTRHALYRHIGVFDLHSSGLPKLVVCAATNVIALQVWNSQMSEDTYDHLKTNLFQFVGTLCNRYRLHIAFIPTLTCYDGDFVCNRKKLNQLLDKTYWCLEHEKVHLSANLLMPWNISTQLEGGQVAEEEEHVLSGKVFESVLSHGKTFQNEILLLIEQMKTINNLNDTKALILFYKRQVMNTLRSFYVPKTIRVFIESSTCRSVVELAVKELHINVPGLNLALTNDRFEADVVFHDNMAAPYNTNISWFRIGSHFTAKIAIGQNFRGTTNYKKAVALFEILHGIGFHREMTMLYSILANSTITDTNKNLNIKRFDPYSILLLGSHKIIGKGIWNFEVQDENNNILSELDKLILNLIFPPCIKEDYKPKISNTTNLLYCGRLVMEDHNHPEESTTDGYCGPNDGANCPSCRTVKGKQVENIRKLHKFQGWSGMVYCGKMEYNEFCGPNYGFPCFYCRLLIE